MVTCFLSGLTQILLFCNTLWSSPSASFIVPITGEKVGYWGCDAQVDCIFEAPYVLVDYWCIIFKEFEREQLLLKYTTVSFVIQIHIESSV